MATAVPVFEFLQGYYTKRLQTFYYLVSINKNNHLDYEKR